MTGAIASDPVGFVSVRLAQHEAACVFETLQKVQGSRALILSEKGVLFVAGAEFVLLKDLWMVSLVSCVSRDCRCFHIHYVLIC